MRKFVVFKGLAITLLMVLSFLQVASAIGVSSPSDEFIPDNRTNPGMQNKISSVDQNKIASSNTEAYDSLVTPKISNPSEAPLSQDTDDCFTTSRDHRNQFGPFRAALPFLESSKAASVPNAGRSNEEQQESQISPVSATDVAFDILPDNNTWNDFAVDDDGNGLFDRLVIDIGQVNQTTNQEVVLVGILKDETGQWLGISQNSTSAIPDTNISLSFAAQPINASGLDGRYNVWLYIFSTGASFPGFNFSLAYTTSQTYDHNDFEAPLAEMVGFSDYASDTDGDLLFDEIIINVSLSVKETGYYTVGVLLGSSDPFLPGTQLRMKTESQYLTPGNRSIEIHLSGAPFFTSQLNGPYNLGFAYISTEGYSGGFPNILQILTDAYNTHSYSYSDFDPPPAFLTRQYWEEGIDTTADGRYDHFQITIEINATQEGRYRVSFILRPSNPISPVLSGSTDGHRYLSSGVQNVSVLIGTTLLYSQHLNTPYVIDQIAIYDHKNEVVDQAFSAYTTQIYNYDAFDIPGASLTGKYSDHGADTDSDGKFDHVVIDVEVNITQPGDYSISIHLRTVASGLPNPYDFWGHAGGFWEVGVQNHSVLVDIPYFYSWRLSSSLWISTIAVQDADYNLLDQASSPYTTQVYNSSEFDIPEAFLTGKYADRGYDSDADGKFDQLQIDAEVNVTQEGTYNLYISLKSYVGSYYRWGSRERWLRPGVYNFTITFETDPVYSWRLNTSFIIESISIDMSGGPTVDQAYNPYTTRIYHYMEFDLPPVVLTGDYWDEGIDTDASGKFDQLLIVVEVNVTEAGQYYLNLNLVFDDFSDLRGDISQYLDVGVWNITVRVRNWALAYLEHFNTAFRIQHVEIYSGSNYNARDQVYFPYTTRIYHYTEFDPPGAYLTGKYWDYGTDTNANDKYDLLVLVIGINVTDAGFYDLEVALESSRFGYQNDAIWLWAAADGFWGTGVHNVSIRFETTSIYYHHVNTSFLIESVNLHAPNYETLDQKSYPYVTRIYSFDEFDIPGAQLTGVYGDQGVDWDSDGKFDALRIFAEINVTEGADYDISMLIISDAGEYFWESAYGYSPVGLQQIAIFLDGPQIYGRHQNSAYRLAEVSIRDANYNRIDAASDVYITEFYMFDQFNAPGVAIVGIYGDQGVDLDYDGEFDFLAIVVGIKVDRPAFCGLRVEIYSEQNGASWWVSGESLPVYYPVGTYNVTVYLQGSQIHSLASSSPWTTIGVALIDEDYNEIDRLDLDYYSHTYDATDFEETGWFNKPPSIGGLFVEMGSAEKEFVTGDFIQLRVGAADEDYIREVRIYINGDEDNMSSAGASCQYCGFWRANYSHTYLFDAEGTYEFYAVAVSSGNLISEKSNIVKITISSESKPKRRNSPGFTSDMLIVAGVVIFLAWGSGWRKRKKDA
ncbi:MAG: hypothetical protein ACE5OZ_13550 [Candidatus Heimdallarchaeota archaeon]